MRISNIHLLASALCGCGIALPLRADDITLAEGGSHLTGNVRSIDGAGVIEFASPLAAEPLLVKGESLEKVVFSNKGAAPEPPPALIELANGDFLPATIVSMDDRNLVVTSPEAGRLEIPRDVLASAQLGIRRSKIVYSGPHGVGEWAEGDSESKNWLFRNNALVARGQATASKKLDLPRQFILRFKLKWQAKHPPNYQVHFADPLLAKGEPCDRYYLQFNSGGLEIKREAGTGKRYNTIAMLNRTPNQYPDLEISVEIRVDRNGSRLQLFINGEPEGEFADPISPVPDGSGISLVCNASNGSDQEIRDIQVLEFDDSRTRHHSEERGDPKTDSLISRDEDRWGGRLLDIRHTGEGALFRFKSDFQDAPLEIPEADVSTVFFASPDAAGDGGAGPQTPFVLKLRGGGVLKVASCGFTGDTVSAVHPLLGRLDLQRNGIVSMERSTKKAESQPEPAPEP